MNAYVCIYNKLVPWVNQKDQYLKLWEEVYDTVEVERLLIILEDYVQERQFVKNSDVESLKKLGQEILARKYKTNYSSYTFEHTKYYEPEFEEDKPEQLAALNLYEKEIDDSWKSLTQLFDKKRLVLGDHMAHGM